MKKMIILTLSLFFSSFAGAQSSMMDDQVNQAALKETQALMNNPTQRNDFITGDPQAKKVDEQVKLLMGENTDEIYRAASDFLPYILQLGHGDPGKMNNVLTQAKRDPASFANAIPVELKQKINVIGQKVKPLPEERKP